MAKNKSFIVYYLFISFLVSGCLYRNEITDTPESKANSTALQTVPIIVYDTIHVQVEISDPVLSKSGKVIQKPDTTKTVTVAPRVKSFEETAALVRKVYKSQIGVYEKTGNNDGVQIKKYLASVGLPEGYPYCAAGIRWTFLQAGVQTKINGAAASTLNKNDLVWFNHKWVKKAHFADVASFWIPSLGGIHHCGFVDSVGNTGNIITVEYNTSIGGEVKREGGGVSRKVRSVNGIYGISRHIKS